MNLYIGIRVSRPAAKTGSRPAVPLKTFWSIEIFDILDTEKVTSKSKEMLKV